MTRRLGRRPGPSQTREAVLNAARRLFAERGYDKTTIRAIGREASVDAALVHHFFGTKEQVFVAAMELPFEPSVVLPQILAGPRDQLAERIVRFFLSVWGDPESRGPFVALLRSATTNEQAAATFREFLESALLGRIADSLGIDRLRVASAAAQMVGIVLLRYVVREETMANATDDEIAAMVTPVVERYLSGATSAVLTNRGSASPDRR